MQKHYQIYYEFKTKNTHFTIFFVTIVHTKVVSHTFKQVSHNFNLR